jgi:DNA-binding IscR family transcriptional regulator
VPADEPGRDPSRAGQSASCFTGASAPGHGGGWTLARPAGEITAREVYAALGARAWAPPETESPGCALEASVNRALTSVYQDVEQVLAARLQEITVADLQRDRFAARGQSHGREECLYER